jgi:glycosyltransferase involved in cell wall biosynthesis
MHTQRSVLVTHVPITDRFAGTERVVMHLASGSVARGRRASVVLPEREGLDGMVDQLRQRKVGVELLGNLHAPTRKKAQGFLQFLQLFRDTRPDIVHFHVPWVPMAWEAVFAAAAARVPVIIRTEHNPVLYPLPAAQRLKLRLADAVVDHVVFVSRGLAQSHFDNGRGWLERWSVIANGVDVSRGHGLSRAELRRSLGLPEQALLAVMLGRLELRKGPLDFVRAAAQAIAAGSAAHFLIVGDGPLRSEVEALIAELGVGSRVLLAGHRNDATALLPACDIFVQPSHYEGLSIAMLEALAAGLPMVTTRVAGVDEVLVDGDGALVCDVSDVAALARNLLSMERDDALRSRFGALLQQHVLTQLTNEKMQQAYESLYDRLLAQQSRGDRRA